VRRFTLLTSFLLIFSFISIAGQESISPPSIFDQTTQLVTKNFYDQTFRKLPWESLVKKARKKISSNSSDEHLKKVLNQLLGKLHASHTEFVSSSDQEYWALESIFSGDVDGAPLKQIGAWFNQIDGRWFVRDVFEGSPAALAGLLPGDEIVTVDKLPLEPVNSFEQSIKDTHFIRIRRAKENASESLIVTATKESFQRTLLRAATISYKVYRVCEKKIGYFHLWAGTNDESQNALAEAARNAAKETDALILDLRDGFGGAYPAYLNPFYDHDDQGKPIQQIYSKPIVVLINNGVRSGKEWIADFLKQTHRATLIGTKTKGYSLAGKIFDVVQRRFALYLAVAKGSRPDLEGNGVKPDIEVPFELQYSAGFDPQLERGLSFLSSSQSDSCK
jgi:carboxyl-terminal processing protease